MKITVVQGDIFAVPCDALVHPTDAAFSGSGGLDRIMQEKGGELLKASCRALANTLKPAQAAATEGGQLQCSHVIHLVSPQRQEEAVEDFPMLRDAMTNILCAAMEVGAQRIAVPLFSTGAGGYDPAKETYGSTDISRYAVTLLSAAADFPVVYTFSQHQEEVIFVCSSEKTYRLMQKAFRWLFGKGCSCRSRIRGSLLGGALGDALGYPVEFFGHDASRVRELQTDRPSGLAVISDDTQMTLFTACGMLFGITRGNMRGIGGPLHSYIRLAYMDWLRTQEPDTKPSQPVSWIRTIPQINALRAPGGTCLSALRQGGGSIREPINNSKGCGGVMRIAPLPLYLAANRHGSKAHAVQECAEAAAITHGHPLGWLSAAALGCILYDLMLNYSLDYAVADTVRFLQTHYSAYPDTARMTALLEEAMALGQAAHAQNCDDLILHCHVTQRLGEGWVGEEALAIGLFAVAATRNGTMEDCLRCAVGHRGDSDSTGSIAGQIRGALMGQEDLNGDWLRKLELREVIEEIADDLANDCRMHEYGTYFDPAWVRKYLSMENSTHVPGPAEGESFCCFQMPFPEKPDGTLLCHINGSTDGYTISLQGETILCTAATKAAAEYGAPGFGTYRTAGFDPSTGRYARKAGWAKLSPDGAVHGEYQLFSFTLLPNRKAHCMELFSDLGPTAWLGTLRRTSDWDNPLEFCLRESICPIPWQVVGIVAQVLMKDVFCV